MLDRILELRCLVRLSLLYEALLNIELGGVPEEPVHAPLRSKCEHCAVAEVEEREPRERIPLRSDVAALLILLRHGAEFVEVRGPCSA